MKKFLLSFGFCFSLFFSYAQCVVSFKGNNGGGSCDPLPGGGVATGTIAICFDVAVTTATAPDITCVRDNSTGQIITDLTFILLEVDANGCAVYCYYEGPNKINNLFGANTSYKFCTSFPGTTVPACPEQIPLPVNFKSFTAVRNHSTVGITWVTSTEQNNVGFELQRKIGSSNWVSVAYIPSQAAGGNSNSALTYSYNDLNPTRGITQYRIRQIDLDGKAKLSFIQSVRGEGQHSKIIVYPNPSMDGKVNVLFDEVDAVRDISLLDMNGRTVKQWRGITNNTLQIDNLVQGIYNLRVVNRETGVQSIEKIMVKR